MKIIENDKTTSAVTMSDGTVVTLPTILLHDEEAALLRQYRNWCDERRLTRTMHCGVCTTPDPMTAGRLLPQVMEMFVTDEQILFSCDHRRLFYQGRSRILPFRFELDPPMPEWFTPSAGPVQIHLNESERELIRAVKQFRRRYDLKESNHCEDCFSAGHDYRLRGGVADDNGRIAWYCAHRAFMAKPSIM